MVKVLRETPEETVIEDRPWLLGAIMILATLGSVALLFHAWEEGNPALGLAAALLGSATGYSFFKAIRPSRLTLSADGTATLSVRSSKGWTHRSFCQSRVRAAVETNRTGDGDTTRPVLLIDGESGVERIPLTAYFVSSDSHEDTVARINAWAKRRAA